jgi:broad specificity phosphatase PhoE
MLSDTKIDGIYATKYKRTQQTVQPLAAAKNLTVEQYEAFKDDEIERILEKHRGGTVVIVGHTNNIPWTANLLTGTQDLKEYDEKDYGIFLMVTVVDKGRNASVMRFNY